ncbi:hypothetical protein SLEP1_g6519 [Rubroshorea leprosula]|uniref:Integrase catalytic domain-containing protein n=1 Tax=Rubroshorea leprosula TaxID=152421 RepID=A0AAV5I1S3_9ROSI|nr:hypothetical protein SLEP1_g6519 [Rubroshorea leprosula]
MVWVRKEKNETVTQTLLEKDDQSLAFPKVASVIVNPDEVSKTTFEAQEQFGNLGGESKEDGTIHFREFSVNLSCLVLTLPLVFQAKKEEEPIVYEFPEQTEEEAIIAEVVSADDKPFSANTHLVEARYYEEDIGTIRFFGMDRHGKPIGITKKLATYFVEKEVQVDRSKIVHEGEEADQGDEITLEEPDLAPAKLDDLKAEVQDSLEEINLGFESESKNARGTDQRAMNVIFHDMVGKFMEIYIDDVVVKSHGEEDHLVHLKKAFEQMRQHGLKMNSLKYAFGVFASNFLGYLVHERGLEVDRNKARVVIEAKPPQNKKELQTYLGQVNFLRRFISNFVGKTRVFSPLLKLKSEVNFKWKKHNQSAFDMIKCTETMSGAGVVVISPFGLKTQMSFQLGFNCTNTQAEYEALIIGLEMLVELKVSMVEVIGDSQLVLNQLSGEHVPRDQNYEANEMTQIASGLQIPEGVGIKMRWLICRHGFFWPFVLKDFIAYAKGCKSCQIHGPLQRVPAFELNSIVKRWPFRGWAIDLIGKVWSTRTITIDQGTVFFSHQVEAFAKEMGFHLLNSTPHYAQANGQVEASNKVVINLLEKMVDDNPRRWHELLSETLWAYKTSQKSSTKMTPFALTYGHDAVLSMKLTARSLRIAIQHNLQSGEYDQAMMLELEDLEDTRLTALDRLQAQKLKITKSYNKRVKAKNLAVGDLV